MLARGTDLGDFVLALDADHVAALVVDNLLDGAVQHVGAAVDGRQTGAVRATRRRATRAEMIMKVQKKKLPLR